MCDKDGHPADQRLSISATHPCCGNAFCGTFYLLYFGCFILFYILMFFTGTTWGGSKAFWGNEWEEFEVRSNFVFKLRPHHSQDALFTDCWPKFLNSLFSGCTTSCVRNSCRCRWTLICTGVTPIWPMPFSPLWLGGYILEFVSTRHRILWFFNS